MHDNRLVRMDANRLTIRSKPVFPVQIFANEDVPVQKIAVDELLRVLDSQRTLDRLRSSVAEFADVHWAIERVAVTPDFHKGAGIPIGTVLSSRGVLFPQALGNDINCGMRLHATNVNAADLVPELERIETKARHLFFEGGRQIPMTSDDRGALLTGGLAGLSAAAPWTRLAGQWRTVESQGWHRQLMHVERSGSLASRLSPAFADWVGRTRSATYDDQIGSIGGGNHFVELQRVVRFSIGRPHSPGA